jgi:hypothetical protein
LSKFLLSAVAVVVDLVARMLLRRRAVAAVVVVARREIRPFTARALWRLRSQSRLARAVRVARVAPAPAAGLVRLAHYSLAAVVEVAAADHRLQPAAAGLVRLLGQIWLANLVA